MSKIHGDGRRIKGILNKPQANMLGLVHSALDINDSRMHGFAQWLPNPQFVEATRKGDKV